MLEIYAHRGSSGTFPENTIPAFQNALLSGCDGVEFDVQLTKDAVPVVIHDEKVDRTTNGTGYVKDMTYKELQALWIKTGGADASTLRVPRLDEVLNVFENSHMRLNIELKTDKFSYTGIEEIVWQKTKDNPRIIFSSFNMKTLQNMRALSDSVELAFICYKENEADEALLDAYQIQSLHFSKRAFPVRKTNRKLRYWTVNQTAEMETFLLAQVAGIFTDFPSDAVQLREWLKQKSLLSKEDSV
ncbi:MULTISPECIES: glycerophosphodiester phosphodiesterase family protein [unclassified Listeria]|uniref:glycerophosphodiester phosphodiesterase family protein n=1 Tax=unclassified Listeria TaxID=2642072 RepID=UPI000B597A46|nr:MULTISPECIES: glycerophosphodiester phosphodiesterase family protein [unclassified Listeria]